MGQADKAQDIPRPLAMAHMHHWEFTPDFLAYLADNLHVYRAFEDAALQVASRGFRHYSARTIIHVLRHHSALTDDSGEWKINNNVSPYLARLFVLLNPSYHDLFEFRLAKAAVRSRAPYADMAAGI